MNYAQDRLDRRALLLSIVQEEGYCISPSDDEGKGSTQKKLSDTEYGQICMTVGWNDHALYHYGMAWYQEPGNGHRMADYAQMLELSGYAERALFAVFAYRMLTTGERVQRLLQPPTQSIECRSNGSSSQPRENSAPTPSPRTKQWYEQSAADMRGRHCGCGNLLCGYPASTNWLSPTAMDHVIQQLKLYCSEYVAIQYQCQTTGKHVSVPTAHEILGLSSKDSNKTEPLDSCTWMHENDIPMLLQFWNDATSEDNAYLPLEPETQLLCLKLLFLVLPSLAIASIPLLRVTEPDAQYKSHWAYYNFLHSLVLGERIKPARRRQMKYQHVALWDRLWGISRDDTIETSGEPDSSHAAKMAEQLIHDFTDRLQQLAEDSLCVTEYSPVWLPPILRPISAVSSGNCKPTTPRPIFIFGDSHVLSLAWQFIHVPSTKDISRNEINCHREHRLVVPMLVTGLKAWHVRVETRFFTNTCLHTILRRLPKHVQTILVSAGEIDCREGMGGPLLQGYTQACHKHIQATVAAYLSSLMGILKLPYLSISQILILPVAPHVQRTKGRVVGRASRRETMRVWNEELRCQLQPYRGVLYLLDYTDQVQMSPPIENETGCDDTTFVPYVLNPIFNADSTHMNGAFAPILEQAIIDCGCDASKI
jgi:hypothetical protein